MTLLRSFAVLSLSACALLCAPIAFAQQALTPRQVAEKFDEELRRAHTTLSVKFKLSTCRYKIEQGQMRCAEKPREKAVENVVKSYGRDIRSISILSEPVTDRGIGMLGYQYWDKNKVNDNWLYLPALNKVKRVVSIKDSKDSGSYFGSEFYIEDLEDPRLDDYSYKILGEEKVKVLEVGKGYVESPAYVLEWTPTAQRRDTTNYGRMVFWVDKKRFILLKGEFYDHDGTLFKRRTIKNLQLVNENWMPRQVTMDNMTTRRVTVMDRLAIAIGLDVEDEYLTQRTLTDHAYRERYLAKFRSFWRE